MTISLQPDQQRAAVHAARRPILDGSVTSRPDAHGIAVDGNHPDWQSDPIGWLRHGITPYRYRGQRRTTVMARLSHSFVNDALTDRVIEQALEVKASEAEERPPTPQLELMDHQASLL